ncbi:MAG TPA: PAS domain S-box protein [Bryobacteraceae bacterium]|nr:PAS domain S-box protein [Bryobacteraceae bacterium]
MRSAKARRWLLAGVLLLACIAIYSYLNLPARNFRQRVYRIGWQNDPPFQETSPDGLPAGLAIELVQNAARNRGIRLQWVNYPGGVEAALRSRDVDLWPLMTILPERKGVFYISKPYLRHDNVLLVHAESPYSRRQDLTSAIISYYELPVNGRLLHLAIPGARLIPSKSTRETIEALCSHRSDAAFLDEFTATAALLSGLPCSSEPMRQISLPSMRTNLGVGATLANASVADEIRRGIDAVAAEGGLDQILADWGQLSSRNLAYFSELLDAGRREPWLMTGLGVITVLLALSVFAWNRIRIQNNRITAAEDALSESEHKLRVLANSLSEVVLAFDMKKNLIFCNPAVERLTGYTADELKKEKPLCWVHPDDRDRVAGNWNRLFEGTSYRDLEYRLVTKDGQMKWASAAWGPMLGEDGRQIGVNGSECEITKRKSAEQALRESERQFRELLEGVQLVALMIDLEGTVHFCNDYTLRLTSLRREQVIGRLAEDLLDREFLSRLHEQAALAGDLPLVEGTLATNNGNRRRIQWSSAHLRDADGCPAGFACVGADVTELENLRAEAARREGDERFRSIADNAPLMIWVTGPDRGCTFVNRGWLAFTGRTLEQEVGFGWTENIHPGDRDSCLANYSSAFAARSSFHVEYRKRRADGEYRWVLGSGIPRYGPEGNFDGYVGTCVDITSLRRTQHESMARQKLETVVSLVSGIAHDFNNLLGAVVAQADLAMAEVAEGSSPEEPLQKIRTVAIRGAGIVRQLMIYAGQEKAISEQLDLSNVVEETVDLLRAVVSKHAVLRTDLAKHLPAINANPAQIRQVLMNLVINASEAIAEREGVITIRTTRVVDSPDSAFDTAREFVQLEVSDNGCGMTLDAQARVFDPFFTTKSPGHGLGLAVVQGIVRSLGGSIQLDSEPQNGTSVRLFFLSNGQTVSAASARAPALPVGSSTPEHQTHAEVVLVVEDETTLRLASAAMLRRRGYSVLEAPDGNTAISLIRQHKSAIALLLLDITLPGAPSREVYAEARRARPDMKIVITSAYGQSAVDASFPGQAVDAFLRKPYQLGNLIEVVRDLTCA